MGSTLGTARPKTPPPHCHVRLLHLPSRRSNRQRPPNRSPLPLLWWSLRRLPPCCRRRCVLRHVRQPHAWSCHHSLLHDRIHRSSPRPLHRRLHHHESPPGLALDRIPCRNHGLPSLWPRFATARRNIPAGGPCSESCRASPPNEELGNTCQARGD